jgi:hypothetical protein
MAAIASWSVDFPTAKSRSAGFASFVWIRTNQACVASFSAISRICAAEGSEQAVIPRQKGSLFQRSQPCSSCNTERAGARAAEGTVQILNIMSLPGTTRTSRDVRFEGQTGSRISRAAGPLMTPERKLTMGPHGLWLHQSSERKSASMRWIRRSRRVGTAPRGGP